MVVKEREEEEGRRGREREKEREGERLDTGLSESHLDQECYKLYLRYIYLQKHKAFSFFF